MSSLNDTRSRTASHGPNGAGGPGPIAKGKPGAPRGARRPPKPKEDRHFVTALARGLQVLASFQTRDRCLGNLEIAERCGLPKSTISRLTATLTKLSYLEQIEDNGKYRLGSATLALGSTMLARLDVRQVARPLMQRLATATRSSVSLGTRDRGSMIYIENCRGSAPITLSLDVGSRVPLVTTALGRAWLAAVSDTERRAVMEIAALRRPDTWPAVLAGIEQALEDHRTLGVTCSFGDWQPDVNGIACALRPGRGLPPMSISCGGPASSLSKDYLLSEARPLLIEIVAEIEAAVGR